MMNLNIPSKIVSAWPNVFQNAVQRLALARTEVERNSIFLGFDAQHHTPVTIHRSILPEHTLILGGPGSNKTSVGLCPMVSQLISHGDESVVIIDLKGDPALFNNARVEAAEARLPFRFFTTVSGRPSYVFNPLEQTYFSRTSRSQRAQQLIGALGLDFGDIYGASFFSSIMELYLSNLMERYTDNILSFVDLHRFCDPAAYKGLGPSDDWQKSRHLHAVLKRLTEVFPLNVTSAYKGGKSACWNESIQVADILKNPSVTYFYMPTTIQSVTSRSIARLFMYSLLTAAALLKGNGRTVTVNVVVDEFQEMVSASTQTVLNQARGFKIPCFLSLQSLDQLKVGDLDLRDVILNGTIFKQVFRIQDQQMWDYLTKMGGEEVVPTVGWKQHLPWYKPHFDPSDVSPHFALPKDDRDWLAAYDIHEQLRPAIFPNLIKQVSANPYASFVCIGKNSGMSNFDGRVIPMFSGYHVDQNTYSRRANSTPWPSDSKYTVRDDLDPNDAGAVQPGTFSLGDAKPDPLQQQFQEGIEKHAKRRFKEG